MFQKQILALSIPMLNGNLFKFTNSTYKYLGKQIGLNLNLKNNFALSPYIGERIQRVRRYHEADPETCQWFKNLLPILSRR